LTGVPKLTSTWLAGSFAHNLGAPWTVAIGGIVSIAGAAVFGLRLPVHRPVAR
jgi:hypothetical protein